MKEKDEMNPISEKGARRLVGMRSFEAVKWLSNFFETRVEHIPNKSYSHLFDTYSQLEVWKEYKTSFKNFEDSPISYSHFLRIWDGHFPNVKIPKTNRFSVCADCEKFKAEHDKSITKENKCKFFSFYSIFKIYV